MATDYQPRPPGETPRRTLGPVAALLVTGIVAGITGGAGAWQLSRAHQKEALQARHDARAGAPPLDTPALARALAGGGDTADAAALYDRRVTLTGTWDDARTLLLDNRPMDGRAGFEVVTPLRLASDGPVVVVVRGWAPRDAVDPRRLPPFTTPAGPVTVHGHLAPPPSRRLELGEQAPGRIRQNLDLAALQRAAGAPERPLVVIEDARDAAPADGLSRHWPAPAVTVDRNYGYALQWFAMCAVTIGLYLWFQILRPRRARTQP